MSLAKVTVAEQCNWFLTYTEKYTKGICKIAVGR